MYPEKIEHDIDNGKIIVKSFKSNFWLYKSIGGEVKVKGFKRKRRWWCLWLCKTEVDKEAEIISIDNTYYSRIDGTAIIVESASHNKNCSNTADCKLRHFAFGIGVKVEFPAGGVTPGTIGDLLPLEGVISRFRVRVDGQDYNFTTAIGVYPEIIID